MILPGIDSNDMIRFLVDLLNIPSPSGYTEAVIDYIQKELSAYSQLKLNHTRKGALVASWEGKRNNSPRAITAHVDTLGAMVKEIKPNGRLQISQIGGLVLNSVEAEGCWVHTRSGQKIRGSYLINKASSHIFKEEVWETQRSVSEMEIRLDARTTSLDETKELGIQVGDFISFDPRVEVTNGFIRSRFLDDKAGIAIIAAAIKSLTESKKQPAQTIHFHFSNFEEVGHGAASGIPEDVTELIALDMAAVGSGQESDEFHATICVKDSSGPYHHRFSTELRELADKYKIPYKVDIYPYYGSDGKAFWRAGGDVVVALIGPGVDASHNYERTHTEALEATTNWLLAYLLSDKP